MQQRCSPGVVAACQMLCSLAPPAAWPDGVLGHRSKAQQPKMPNRWLVFEVADTGCGIAPEGLQSLFKEFVQVRTPRAGLWPSSRLVSRLFFRSMRRCQ